jgi:hypothetical protein
MLTDLAMNERLERRITLQRHKAAINLDNYTNGWLATHSFDEGTGMVKISKCTPALHRSQTALALTRPGITFLWDRRSPTGGHEPRLTRQQALDNQANGVTAWDRSDSTGCAIVHLLQGGRARSSRTACSEALGMLARS